ncbi:TPA: hypothetical protein ACXJQL_002287 [Stenotrophomonas maltophilia]
MTIGTLESLTESELFDRAIQEMLKCPEYPKIGAVISKNGRVLSTGFKGEVKGVHAERVAIEKLSVDQLNGAKIHTTLEPCVEMSVDQPKKSCCALILESGISTVSIGVLDPNGRIYANGMNSLRDGGIKIEVFPLEIRQRIEAVTFPFDDFSKAIGDGKRRIRSVKNGKKFEVQFSIDDHRKISFSISPLSMPLDRIDLVSDNDSVRLAPDITKFGDIPDPMLYQDPSHFARLGVGEIAVIAKANATMALLVKILDISSTDILIQWEVRDIP